MKDLPKLIRSQLKLSISDNVMNRYQDIIDEFKLAKANNKANQAWLKTQMHEAGELLGKLRQFCSLSKVLC